MISREKRLEILDTVKNCYITERDAVKMCEAAYAEGQRNMQERAAKVCLNLSTSAGRIGESTEGDSGNDCAKVIKTSEIE